MNRFLILVGTLTLMGSVAAAQTDLGAQIAAADAALGSAPGTIPVTASGTIREGQVSISAGHDLVCNAQVVISLNPGSYIYQNSNTTIKNCIISSSSTPIAGEIQSVNTNHVELDNVTFVGGGNLLYWDGVTDFTISGSEIDSITASDPATQTAMTGFFLIHCARGEVDNLTVKGFVFPAGTNNPDIVGLNLSDSITINNPVIQNVDASFVIGPGAGAIALNGSTNVTINGGVITGNSNTDGVLSQSYKNNVPSSHLTVTGLNSSNNGGLGLNAAAPLGLGDGIDVINTSHILISHCTLNGNGSLNDQQPGIWIFIDDDVVVEDSDISNGSRAGVAAAGSTNVHLIRDTINHNQATGVFAEFQGGTVTNVGPAVTFVFGVSGGFGLAWPAGTPLILDGITYQIASVTDSMHLTLSTAPPDHSSPVPWSVETTEEIRDSNINDNGLARFGGQDQVGMSWADATTGTISGVTSINTDTGAQLYGLEFANTASAILSGNNFSTNLVAGDGILGSPQFASPVMLSFPNQGVATTSTAQTVTLTAGVAVLQNLVIQTSGDFSETSNCGTGLAAFATCQIQVAFAPTAAGTLNGVLTVTDGAPDSPLSVSLTGTAVIHSFGLNVAPGASNSVTVAAGGTARYSLAIGGTGTSGTALLSCTGAPAGATCNVPATLAFNPTQATSFSVVVTTRSSRFLGPGGLHPAAWLWTLGMSGIVFLPAGIRTQRRNRRYPFWTLLFLLVFLCSCGGRDSISAAPGTYTLTVTANVGNNTEQIPLTLVVK